jgi:hypothetical protein
MAESIPSSDEGLTGPRIRMECLGMAHQVAPVFLNLHQGSVQKMRNEVLSLAKRYETFILTGKSLSADDFKKEVAEQTD